MPLENVPFAVRECAVRTAHSQKMPLRMCRSNGTFSTAHFIGQTSENTQGHDIKILIVYYIVGHDHVRTKSRRVQKILGHDLKFVIVNCIVLILYVLFNIPIAYTISHIIRDILLLSSAYLQFCNFRNLPRSGTFW